MLPARVKSRLTLSYALHHGFLPWFKLCSMVLSLCLDLRPEGGVDHFHSPNLRSVFVGKVSHCHHPSCGFKTTPFADGTQR